MKILYIYKYGIFGGVSTQIYNRLSYLNSLATTELLFFKDYGVSRLFKENKMYFTDKIWEITSIIQNGSYDLISIIDTPEAIDALTQNPTTENKVILEIHTTTANISYLTDLRENIDRLKHISFFVTPSEYLLNRIENEFCFKNVKRCHIVPNTIDTELFNYLIDSPTPGKKIVLWVGKLDDHKNWEGFLEIASKVAAIDDDLIFWMVGGYTAPKERIQKLITMIDDLDLTEKVKWFPLIKYEHMPLVYSIVRKSGGCHLITSLDESFGMTMIESLAIGCPVIAANVGALPEVMNKISPELLYEYGDYAKGAELLQKLMNEPERFRQRMESKIESIREEYSISVAAKKYYTLIKNSV